MQSKIKNQKSKIENPSIPALILAAGSSSRLGTPKQLLLYQNQTLLAHAIHTAADASFSPILVILGHDPTGAIQKEAHAAGVPTVHNPDWQRGLGTTIRTGLAHFSLAPCPPVSLSPPALLLMLSDQPLLTPAHLRQLRTLSTPDNLVAAAYNNTIGPPAIIGRRFFPELLALPDNQGAKQILLRHPTHLKTLPLPEAAYDIDTPQDLPLPPVNS